LFERLPGGVYLPTTIGERAAAVAERMETEAHALDREISGSDARLMGNLRVTASETLAFRILTEQLARFRSEHPGITVELSIDNRILDLARREADIALRVTRPKEPELFGKKLAEIGWTIYGAPSLLGDRPAQDAGMLVHLPFVGWSEGTRGVAAADWLEDQLRPTNVVYRANSLINQFSAAREGMGLAVLPCYLGDLEPGLTRAVQEPIVALTRELWIVTHEDLKATARVRAFLETVGEGLAGKRAVFAGT
jgi:DNA-binding transcriptional LysR family regulator